MARVRRTSFAAVLAITVSVVNVLFAEAPRCVRKGTAPLQLGDTLAAGDAGLT